MGYTELLGSNRGFELGDASQFTISGTGSNGVQTATVGEGSYAWKLWCSVSGTGYMLISETMFSDPVPGIPGQTYRIGCFASILAQARAGSSTHRYSWVRLYYYDSGGVEISYEDLIANDTLAALYGWTWFEKEVIAPAGTATMKWMARVQVDKYETGGAESASRTFGVDLASIALKTKKKIGAVYLSDYGVV